MFRILVVAQPQDNMDNLMLSENKIVATVLPGTTALDALLEHNPDLVITNAKTAALLNSALVKSSLKIRTNIIAKTHQGVQLVPITDIYYFQADDKYVTAYHTQGELLIEDSLATLEKDFTDNFIRIHRKTLVAINKIEKLFKGDDEQHYIKLLNKKTELSVSRRQLPKVRKALLCL